jgi:SnoaL-like domain
MADLETMVQELRDRDEIARLIRTYAHGIDRRDWSLVRSCFSDDAEAQGSRSTGPIEPYLAEVRPGVEFYPTTMHFMGNQLIELDGDTARVETYAVAYHWKDEVAGTDHPENLVVGVRYLDTVQRRNERWRITRRQVAPDWRTGPYPQT